MPNDYVTIKQFGEFKEEMSEFRGEMRDFRKAVFELYDVQKKEYRKQIGAIIENNAHWAKFVVESFKMDIERLDRKFGLNEEEHQKFDKRISRVEAASL